MTPIQKKHEETGGESGFLGKSTTGETTTPDGQGIYQEFERGIIYYHADFGACVMGSQVVAKWKSDSVNNAFVSDGRTTIQNYLGFPIQDTVNTTRGEVCYFERGMIVCQGALFNSFVVYGSIYIAYRRHNDVVGWMGYPRSDEQAGANGGRASFFEQGDIYWHPDTGAFEVHGGIREKYNQLGASGSILGYPTSDENAVLANGSEAGRSNSFQGGVIFWSGATGAFEMHGALLHGYLHQYNGPAGELGFPLSDEQRSPNDVFRFNNFQHGVLAFDMRNGTTRKVSNLKLVVTRLETDEDDDDLLVRASASITAGGREIHRSDKQFGEYTNTGTKTLAEHEGLMGNFPVRDGHALLTVTMKAWDVDGGFNFDDDIIGEFTKRFGIETLWDATLPDLNGNTLQTWHNGPDGRFKAEFRLEPDGFVTNPFNSEQFRRDLFWNIHNPCIPVLDFDTYAATFSDVEADDGPVFHPFNHIFYQAAYKKSAKTGTCFGMCLEAVYALKGRSASRQPIGQYVYDEQRKKDINIKFGYQMGGSQINFLLRKFKAGELWDPVLNFHRSRDLFFSGNYATLCLSKDFSIAGGHAVLPYKWDDSNPREWKIYVANPNSPFNENSDNNFRDAVISIDPVNNQFTYQHEAAKTWKGGKGLGNGGRMFCFPYSELSTEPRTPFWEALLTLLTGGIYIILAGDAEISQVTDNTSNQHFNIDGSANANSLTRIKNLMEVEALGMPRDPLISTEHFFRNINPALFMSRQKSHQVFYYKANTEPGDMYHRSRSRSRARRFNSSERLNQVAVMTQSQAFAQNVNPENVTLQFSQNPELIQSLRDTRILEIVRNKSLVFDISAKTEGEYVWAFATGKSKVILSTQCSKGPADQVTLDSINQAGQAFTYKMNGTATEKKIKVSVLSYDNKIRYELSDIALSPGETFTVQHNNACRELIMNSSAVNIQFNLDLYLNHSLQPALSKTNVPMEAGKTMLLEPENWADVELMLPEAGIKLDVFDHLGGTLLQTKIM
jgi:hypothetical protein